MFDRDMSRLRAWDRGSELADGDTGRRTVACAISNCDYDEAANEAGIIVGTVKGQHLDYLSVATRIVVTNLWTARS